MCFSTAACVACFWVVQAFGRKTLLVFGQVGFAVILFVAGLCLYLEQNMIAYISICLFVMAFNLTQGSVAWLYVPEVTQDEQSGLCVTMQFFFMLQLTMTFEYVL